MIITRSLLTLGFVFALSVPAHAESINQTIEDSGQYWQRISTSSAIYMRGPKAQQMLNRDISRCVVELREMERLGVIRDSIPKYIDENRILTEDEARLAGVDIPERDEELFYEHSDYHDFEGCMLAKGWERTKYVPYDVAYQAREDYLDAHVKYRDRHKDAEEKAAAEADDFKDLNE